MLNVIETGPVPNSLATKLTVLDERERVRREKEFQAAKAWLEACLKRSQREIFSEIATITPAMAELLLHRNPDNRALRATLVAEIRSDLENGRWVFNGETIIVSRDGLLNDGQHRLAACRDSGMPLKTVIIFGVQRSARLTTDQGAVRRVSDYLAMEGRDKDSMVVAAVARLILQYEKNGAIDVQGGGGKDRSRRWSPTRSEILSVANDRSAAINMAIERVGKGSKVIASKSLLAFCIYIFAKKDQTAAFNFFDALITGSNVREGTPVHTLRKRFIEDQTMPAKHRFEAIVRAWNAHRASEPLSKIMVMGRVPKVSG